jgi:hypothetical protein
MTFSTFVPATTHPIPPPSIASPAPLTDHPAFESVERLRDAIGRYDAPPPRQAVGSGSAPLSTGVYCPVRVPPLTDGLGKAE